MKLASYSQMEPHADTSSSGLVRPTSTTSTTYSDDQFYTHRFRRFKVLGAWTVILSAFFFLSLLVFEGLCYGYQRHKVTLFYAKLIPVILLVSGVTQVTLGLFGASKTYKLRYITVNTVDANPMQNYVVINILIAIISVCHCVCYGLLFLRRGDLEVFMAKRHTFLSSGYQPIAIASVNLIAMSVITLVTAIVSASSVCCCRPDKKRHQVYKFDNIIESDGDVWSRRSMDTAITDIASW